MPPKDGRCRPFTLTFLPGGKDEVAGGYKPKVIPVNAAPVEIQNAHFKGLALLVHDTGNEPCPRNIDASERKGVDLQIQGRFKRSINCEGDEAHKGLWVGGELPGQLKLGWIMQNIVQLCMKYARKKTDGRLHFSLGSKTDNPHMSFPAGQLFECIITPPGEQPPELGGDVLRNRKYSGPSRIDIDAESTYTLMYKTPFLDLCSWELLKVPGVSPLPLESILGDLTSAEIMMFDLGIAGTHANWRKAVLLEWVFRRGAEGDTWVDTTEEREPEEHAPLASVSTSRTAQDDDADDEDSNEAGSEAADEDDALVAVEDHQDAESNSSGAGSSVDSLCASEDEETARADSMALRNIEGWKPRTTSINAVGCRVPYYIEAIDRRRRRKVRIWYVIRVTGPEGETWWHAKAEVELAELCRPKRKLKTFRRGPGARRYTCCTVNTLERFRYVVSRELEGETKLRDVVMAAAMVEAELNEKGSTTPTPPRASLSTAASRSFIREEEEEKRMMSPKQVASLALKAGKRTRRGPMLPPRFFVASGSACSLAFMRAVEGRANVSRETLVGSVHFEGRICEELMRLSTDGMLRCFTPYDCDRPRVRIRPSELLHAEPVEGLFLGRFYMWQVQTLLRVFVFCSSEEQDRADWVRAVLGTIEAAKSVQTLDDAEAKETKMDTAASQKDMPTSQKMLALGGKLNGVASTLHSTLHMVSVRYSLREPRLTDLAAALTDSTRARRWRGKRRLVLNDRQLVPDSTQPPLASIAAGMLETVLQLPAQPATSELIAFADSTCLLKAVRFDGWQDAETLAFWLNVYHCLLLHGWLLLGKPESRMELKRFHNRVSYLVALRPVSLREIEQVILRIPQVEGKSHAVKQKAGAGARKFLGCLCFCRKRNHGSSGMPPTPQSSDGEKEEHICTVPQASPSHKVIPHTLCLDAVKAGQCLPMPNLPSVPWSSVYGHHPCLYLGEESVALAVPPQDLRCVLGLNRGHHSCLPDIPVFHAENVHKELDNVARKFVAEFVQVQVRDGRPVRATMPDSCKAFTQEMGTLWRFMPSERVVPTESTRLKFQKGNEDPRQRSDFRKLDLIVHTHSHSAKKEVRSTHKEVSGELTVVTGTTLVLATLAAAPGSPSKPPPGVQATIADHADPDGMIRL